MENHKMVALSTAHLTEHTCNTWLPAAADHGFSAFPKADWGWFIPIMPVCPGHSLPRDLAAVMSWAKLQGASWIMFDRDVEAIDELTYHDW